MNNEKANIKVGIVISTTLEEWPKIEAQLSRHVDVIFVKKVPLQCKLRIKESIENENGDREDVKHNSGST